MNCSQFMYYSPFRFEGRVWDLIVPVPDHCLSFYFVDCLLDHYYFLVDILEMWCLWFVKPFLLKGNFISTWEVCHASFNFFSDDVGIVGIRPISHIATQISSWAQYFNSCIFSRYFAFGTPRPFPWPYPFIITYSIHHPTLGTQTGRVLPCANINTTLPWIPTYPYPFRTKNESQLTNLSIQHCLKLISILYFS